MYIYNIAIRWDNGDLQGFGASSLTEQTAYARALEKATRKQNEFGIKAFKVLTSREYSELSIDDQDAIQLDWDGSQL
jgi:hypothetical protein